jgi:hypothetical protein
VRSRRGDHGAAFCSCCSRCFCSWYSSASVMCSPELGELRAGFDVLLPRHRPGRRAVERLILSTRLQVLLRR